MGGTLETRTKRYLGFTLEEISILFLGAIGLFVLSEMFVFKWWRVFIVTYSLGLCFEALMAPLFTYDKGIRLRHCIDGSDVNFILPLGWIEISSTSAFVSFLILGKHSLLGYIVSAFIIGNLHEFLFYKLKFWKYNYDKAIIANYKPLYPKITIAGVPIQVMIGYCNVGIFSYFIFNILVR